MKEKIIIVSSIVLPYISILVILTIQGYYIKKDIIDEIDIIKRNVEYISDNDFYRERKYIFINTYAPRDTFVMISKNAEWALNGLYGMGAPPDADARIVNIIDLDETWRGY